MATYHVKLSVCVHSIVTGLYSPERTASARPPKIRGNRSSIQLPSALIIMLKVYSKTPYADNYTSTNARACSPTN